MKIPDIDFSGFFDSRNRFEKPSKKTINKVDNFSNGGIKRSNIIKKKLLKKILFCDFKFFWK